MSFKSSKFQSILSEICIVHTRWIYGGIMDVREPVSYTEV